MRPNVNRKPMLRANLRLNLQAVRRAVRHVTVLSTRCGPRGTLRSGYTLGRNASVLVGSQCQDTPLGSIRSPKQKSNRHQKIIKNKQEHQIGCGTYPERYCSRSCDELRMHAETC